MKTTPDIPQNLELERDILGLCLTGFDADCPRELITLLSSDDFYHPNHQTVYDAVKCIVSTGGNVDLVTVTNHLKSIGKLKTIGAATVSALCIGATGGVEGLRYYAGRLKEYTAKRALLRLCQTAMGSLGNGVDISDLIPRLERDLISARTVLDADDYNTQGIVNALDKRRQEVADGKLVTIPTGFTELDTLLSGGLATGFITCIKGDVGYGKSAFAIQVCDAMACTGHPVLYISLEMKKEDIWPRVVGSRLYRMGYIDANIDYTCLRNTQKWIDKNPDCRKIEVIETNWFIDDREQLSIDQVIRCIRRHVEKHGVQVAVIDTINEVRIGAEYEAAQSATGRLRVIAKELNIIVIVCVQRSTGESRKDGKQKERVSSDVFYWTTIPQVAAHVIGIGYDDKAKMHRIIISKSRFSGTGVREYQFIGKVQTFQRDGRCGFYVPTTKRLDELGKGGDSPVEGRDHRAATEDDSRPGEAVKGSGAGQGAGAVKGNGDMVGRPDEAGADTEMACDSPCGSMQEVEDLPDTIDLDEDVTFY